MNEDMEFVLRPEAQAIFDHFCALLGIRIAFYTPEGKELWVGQRKPGCRYCRLLRGKLGWGRRCLALDAAQRTEAVKRRTLVEYVCHGGLHEAILPVYSVGRLIGFIMIGQFRSVGSAPGGVMREWAGRYPGGELRKAFREVACVAPGKVRDVMGLFEVLVQFISSQRLIHLKDAVGPVLARMREKPEERLTLGQAAAMVKRSPSAFSHLFRRATGRSFKRTQVEARLERADEYFRANPGMTVREVAFKLGFDDPLYFSRLYRKHRGRPPSRLILD
ncbi:MAG: PocR ligand-binding domain-containing protein [Verrucomicrobiae bacterium]|nr:PocR ligand-binding domain-containing protein [Verrucomicrobiae bacterium]